MSALSIRELERLSAAAGAVATALTESLQQTVGVEMELSPPQADRIEADGLPPTFSGSYFLAPIDVTGNLAGVMCVLFQEELDSKILGEEQASEALAVLLDEALPRASDRLTVILGGAVSLDRAGLRLVLAEDIPATLGEILGKGRLGIVRFKITAPTGGGPLSQELVVAFSEDAADGLSVPAPSAEETRSTGAVLGTGSGGVSVTVPVSVELGRRRITLAEALELLPGTLLELPRGVSDPLEIRVGGHLVAYGDAVRLGDRLAVKVR